MNKIIILICLSLSGTSIAETFKLKNLYLIHKDFKQGSRNPLIDDAELKDKELDQELSLYWDLDIANVFYWNNQIYSLTDRHVETGDTSQFRVVGWHFLVGIRITSWLDAGYAHFSKHLLDKEYPNYRFPVQDSIFVRLNFYTDTTRQKSLL